MVWKSQWPGRGGRSIASRSKDCEGPGVGADLGDPPKYLRPGG